MIDEVLEHCRERAYRFDELHWWANLTLLLAATGMHEEAFSAFDETQRFVSRVPKDPVCLDELTNLIEAATLRAGAPGTATARAHAIAANRCVSLTGPRVRARTWPFSA